MRPVSRSLSALVVTGTAILLGGCGATPAQLDPVPAAAVTTSTPTSQPAPQPDASAPYTAGTRRVQEKVGSVAVDVVLPQLEGGDAAVRGAVDKQVSDKVKTWLNPQAASGKPFTLTGDGGHFTHIGAQVASAETAVYLDTVPPGANPTNFVDGDTWRLDTGARIAVTDLFRNGDLRDLAAGARQGLEAQPERKGQKLDDKGLAPTAENFDQFTVDPDGITVYFEEYQLGGNGNGQVTVRWNDLRGTLDPSMLGVVTS